MSPNLLAVLMLINGIAAGALIAIASYAPELRFMARFLERRDTDDSGAGNARVTVNSSAPGIADLAAVMNAELDRSAAAHVEDNTLAIELLR